MHPATASILKHFEYDHLPEPLKHVSSAVHGLAHWAANSLPEGPELTVGLRGTRCRVKAAHPTGQGRPAPPHYLSRQEPHRRK